MSNELSAKEALAGFEKEAAWIALRLAEVLDRRDKLIRRRDEMNEAIDRLREQLAGDPTP